MLTQRLEVLIRVTVAIRLEAPKWRAAGPEVGAPIGDGGDGVEEGGSGTVPLGTGSGTGVLGASTGGFGGSTGGFGGAGTGGVETVGTGGGGGSGAGGTVTVGTLTVGIGGTCPRLVPAQAPSSPRTSKVGTRTGTDRRIRSLNGLRPPVVSPHLRAGNTVCVARDLYEVLGVGPDAGAEEIKQAYRSLAREAHPDVSGDPGSDERFREVTEAYAVLSDHRARRLYDRLGWQGRGAGIAPRSGLGRVYAGNPRAFFEDVESVLSEALGRPEPKRPQRVVGEVELDPYEAHVGATRPVEVAETLTCDRCSGSGRVKAVDHRDSGRFLSFDACRECRGTGQVERDRAVEVTVPPGTRNRDRVPVGPNQAVTVSIVPARDRTAIRLAAAIALLAAVGFLLFLLAL